MSKVADKKTKEDKTVVDALDGLITILEAVRLCQDTVKVMAKYIDQQDKKLEELANRVYELEKRAL